MYDVSRAWRFQPAGRKPMTMREWIAKFDGFLTLSDRPHPAIQ
jgi:hypothetical protein